MTRFIGFIPPIVGLEGEFNTFRIGLTLAKCLSIGEIVFLANLKESIIIGSASIEKIDFGRMDEMCVLHATKNHTEKELQDGRSAERLFALLQKIYGPHIATCTKKTSVIYLKRRE